MSSNGGNIDTTRLTICNKVHIPLLKFAASGLQFMIVAVPILLGLWAGVPEIKDLVNKTTEQSTKSSSQDTGSGALKDSVFGHVVYYAGIGYIVLFTAKVMMRGPQFWMCLLLGTVAKWLILLAAIIQRTGPTHELVRAALAIVISGVSLAWEALKSRSNGDPTWIILISGLIENILTRVGLQEEPLLGNIQLTEITTTEPNNERQDAESDNGSGPNGSNGPTDNGSSVPNGSDEDDIEKDETVQLFYDNLQEIVKEGCLFMHWESVLILGYGNMVSIFKKSPHMWIYLVIYTCIGCISFNCAKICRQMSLGFLFLVCLGYWMEMTIWETVLVNIHFEASYLPILFGCIPITFGTLIRKFILVRREDLQRREREAATRR